MADTDDTFLSRWARRKTQARSGAVLQETPVAAATSVATVAPPPTAATTPTAASATTAPTATSVASAASALSDEAPAAPLPSPLTLDDVARLTATSDYSRFVAPSVDARVRNAAMKKLFTDPHFNVMDGLDTYIEDYGKPDPIPLAMLRRMNQSKFLGLFDDEAESEEPRPPVAAAVVGDAAIGNDTAAGDLPPDCTVGAASGVEMESAAAPASQRSVLQTHPETAHEDADLRLQPDHAARSGGLVEGTRA